MDQTSTIQDIQEDIINEFDFFDDWDEKYGYIIELGKKLQPLSDEHKNEQNLIRGCQSQVWMISRMQDGKVIYEADSDAIIVKGLVMLLLRILSGQKPEDIINTDLNFLEKVGLMKHLSPTRSNGLASMVKQMKLDALAYKAKETN